MTWTKDQQVVGVSGGREVWRSVVTRVTPAGRCGVALYHGRLWSEYGIPYRHNGSALWDSAEWEAHQLKVAARAELRALRCRTLDRIQYMPEGPLRALSAWLDAREVTP